MIKDAVQNKKILEDYEKVVNISSIITKTDATGRIIYANDNFCKISGYEREELIGKPHNIVRHPDESAESFGELWKTIQSKKVWQGTLKNMNKSGGAYYTFATVMPFLDDNGEVFEYISLRQDVTELQMLTNELEKRVEIEVQKNKAKDEEAIKKLHMFLDSTPNLIIIYQNNRVAFVNKPFLELVGKSQESLLGEEFDFSSLLDQDGAFVTKEEDLQLHKKSKISITINGIRTIFSLFHEEIGDSDNNPLTMYTMNNITVNEYQKLKITHYNDQLREYYRRNKTSKTIDSALEKKEDLFEKLDAKPSGTARELSGQESELLNRKHSDLAVSSQEYSQEIDSYILQEIQELGDIEDEITHHVHELEEKNMSALPEIISRLLKLASVLKTLMEFKELAFSIDSLANLLDTQDISKMDDRAYRKMLLFLSNIILDLASWRNIVFVEQSANDIHYMDSSLFSSILQFELLFNLEQQVEAEEEDDFELF